VPSQPTPNYPGFDVPEPGPRPGLDDPPAGQAERIAVGFARSLRAAGVAVPPGKVLTFVAALGQLGLDRRSAVYWAGHATLVGRPEDRPVFDRIFDAFWLRQLNPSWSAVTEPVTVAFDDGSADDADPDGDESDGEQVMEVRYSRAEILRHRDFARLSPEEWAEAQRLITELKLTAQLRQARRRRPARRGDHPDLRRTVRQALRTGGEPARLFWRARTTRPRRLVLLVDVSGSMDSYARALLRLAHAAMRARNGLQVEVFTLGTRLTRLTRELSQRDPDSALAAAAGSVQDWSGGTRLGECLRDFNDRWGARGMARGAVMVVFSDGWDRGDPDELGAEMARLSRLTHRLVWVNPLKASPGFAPLARGMAAALPWVDDFVTGHSVAALQELAAVIAGHGGPGESGTSASSR
jgi:uncharacterized protein with von Willebrand factor type A (vWA) domain